MHEFMFTKAGRVGAALVLFGVVFALIRIPKVKDYIASSPLRKLITTVVTALLDGALAWGLGASPDEALEHFGVTFIAASGIHQNVSTARKILAELREPPKSEPKPEPEK